MTFILADADTAGFLRSVKGGQYIDLAGVPKSDELTGLILQTFRTQGVLIVKVRKPRPKAIEMKSIGCPT